VSAYGPIGNGTVGALFSVKEIQQREWPSVDGSILFGVEDDEESDNIGMCNGEERELEISPFEKVVNKGKEINEEVWMITAAHVAFSKLTMSTDQAFAPDNNKKNQEFNDDKSISALYNPKYDVALLPLPRMKYFSRVKLHMSSKGDSYTDWSPSFLKIENNITVIKIGAKTGITVGKFAGIVNSVVDIEGTKATYSNCVAVRHAEKNVVDLQAGGFRVLVFCFASI
jgi:hypothetical protein